MTNIFVFADTGLKTSFDRKLKNDVEMLNLVSLLLYFKIFVLVPEAYLYPLSQIQASAVLCSKITAEKFIRLA